MAARPGEENVAVLFADIHYFYSPPDDKPQHHRFDKGSYVYLFEDANQARARVEIANQPGTNDQDAFDGYLDTTHLHYSYKHTCVVTLTVGDVDGHEEWHLPTYDPHNQNKYHYKLHSLDIYFWTQQDALSFVNGIRRVVAPSQCEILDEPGPPPRQHHPNDVSAVVQQLEKAAIADSSPSHQPGVPSFAPPPVSAVSGTGSDAASPPAAFVPIPYNPAAPPAPEQVRHREKTPPPEDGGLNPLHATLAHDATTPFSPGLVPPAGYGSPIGPGPLSPAFAPPQHFLPPASAPQFPGPPVPAAAPVPHQYPGFGSLGAAATASATPPPVHPGLARAATMPVAAAHPHMTIGAYPQSPGFAPPGTPGLASPGLPPATAPPVGGYSGYNYGAAAAPPVAPGQEYGMHQQLYRPTQGEIGAQYTPKKEGKGKLEENAGRLERGVTGMFKKFEKKFG
ncbi:hypothetical protein CONLIGDRAFT_460544 [Coniochaeta ligniaria NRRL 30616]|uniref:RNA recognition motif-containing protein n=1 Tax=Coniochaeta ligniaria NRRL 30616 TaxID=1408157 RepID=A0A1J7IKZ0_9PEZI|nr:hypothetical protein CONLIGDRAFT_460544 [Coniochaeta ligniaria NRRL 30616]